jgi:hypothetical protein
MDIHKSLVPILQNINFASRYSELCKRHSNFDKSLEEYDKSLIQKFLESNGIKVLFVKSENFFKIAENIGELSIQFNIIPKRGFLQFVWDVKRRNERLDLSLGMWEAITRELSKIEAKKPLFSSLDELQEILKEALSIYEDFKQELLKMGENHA